MCQLLEERQSETQSKRLRELFIQRLPTNIHMILAPASTKPLDAFVELADRIAEHVLLAVITVATTACPSSSVSLEARLQELTVAVHTLQFANWEHLPSLGQPYQQ